MDDHFLIFPVGDSDTHDDTDVTFTQFFDYLHDDRYDSSDEDMDDMDDLAIPADEAATTVI